MNQQGIYQSNDKGRNQNVTIISKTTRQFNQSPGIDKSGSKEEFIGLDFEESAYLNTSIMQAADYEYQKKKVEQI